MKIPVLSLSLALFTVGCIPTPAPTVAPLPTQTDAPFPTHIPIPSPTDIQLPFNPNIRSDEYCQPPYAFLSLEAANGMSDDKITVELVKIWLERYAQPDTPAFCFVEEYSIDKVYDDPAIYSSSLEPVGDFKRIVFFSIKLTQIPSDWMSLPGELDPENWLHTGHIVAITKTEQGYEMEFAFP